MNSVQHVSAGAVWIQLKRTLMVAFGGRPIPTVVICGPWGCRWRPAWGWGVYRPYPYWGWRRRYWGWGGPGWGWGGPGWGWRGPGWGWRRGWW